MTNIRKIGGKYSLSQILFFISLGIYLVSEILSSTFYLQYFEGRLFWVIRGVWLGILIVREFFVAKEYNIPRMVRLLIHNIRWLIGLGVLAVLAAAITLYTRDFTVCYILIFLFCARDLNFDSIAKFSFFVILCSVVFVIISSYAGIIENYTYSSSTRIRHYLGFLYSLYLPAYVMTLSALLLYFRKSRITWIEMVLLALANVWVYLETDSRLSFFVAILMILVFAFLKIKPDFLQGKRVLGHILVFSFVICFIISLVLALIYDDSIPIMKNLNELLSSRLKYAHSAIDGNGIHLFCQNLDMVGNGLDASGELTQGTYFYVDSIYIQFLLRNGVVFSVLWFAFLTLTMYYFYRVGNFYMLVCLTFYAICGIFDDLTFRLYFNTFWLAGSWILTRLMSQGNSKPTLFPGGKSDPCSDYVQQAAGDDS